MGWDAFPGGRRRSIVASRGFKGAVVVDARRWHRARATGVAVGVVLVATTVAATTVGAAAQARSLMATSAGAIAAPSLSPLTNLPPGLAPPNTMPYAIGKNLYFAGKVLDLSSTWRTISPSGAPELLDVDQTRGVAVLKVGSRVTTVVPGHAPRVVLSTAAPNAQLATTTGGFFTAGQSTDLSMRVYTYTGVRTLPDVTFPVIATCGDPDLSCSPYSIGAGSVGGMFIARAEYAVQLCTTDPFECSVWSADRAARVYPTQPQAAASDHTHAAGRGQVAVADSWGSSCYRTAATVATILRAHLCSDSVPLVSDDGSRAVLVKAGAVSVASTTSGATMSTAGMPPAQEVTPLIWTSATSYLLSVKDHSSLLIVRCYTSGRCERAVTSQQRPGVSRIVS